MKMISDGWHVVSGYEVFVESGNILRGILYDPFGSPLTAYVYRRRRDGSWSCCSSISVSAFRSAVRRGTVDLF